MGINSNNGCYICLRNKAQTFSNGVPVCKSCLDEHFEDEKTPVMKDKKDKPIPEPAKEAPQREGLIEIDWPDPRTISFSKEDVEAIQKAMKNWSWSPVNEE